MAMSRGATYRQLTSNELLCNADPTHTTVQDFMSLVEKITKEKHTPIADVYSADVRCASEILL